MKRTKKKFNFRVVKDGDFSENYHYISYLSLQQRYIDSWNVYRVFIKVYRPHNSGKKISVKLYFNLFVPRNSTITIDNKIQS